MKKFVAYILITLILLCPLGTYASPTAAGNIGHEFNRNYQPENILFTTNEPIIVSEDFTIPENSIINAKYIMFQKERRWHKSGYFVCQLLNFSDDEGETFYDVSGKEIFLIARKREPINKKEAAILGTEIVVTQAASIVGSCFIYFAPVDIVYFFTKGAIQRQKHPNWFKAGVFNAYDNSIFWFWLKGRPIDLENGDSIKVKTIKPKKAKKLEEKMIKHQAKLDKKNQKRELKVEAKKAKLRLEFEKYDKTLIQEGFQIFDDSENQFAEVQPEEIQSPETESTEIQSI